MIELEAFRTQARNFRSAKAAEFGYAARRGLDKAQDLALARRWQRTKYDSSYAGIAWKSEFGGAGLIELHQAVFAEEEARHGFPTSYFGISLSQLVPIMTIHAPNLARERFGEPALKGEEIWCQLFSEPAAGSDLAGLRLRAVRDGGDWVVNGQKLWTSWAQPADFGVVLVRTDPAVPKHEGLTYFWLDMKTPGISVRSIRLANGEYDLNEVLFDDVRIPDSQRLGRRAGASALRCRRS